MRRIALLFVIAAVSTTIAPGADAVGLYGIYWNPKAENTNEGWGGGLKYGSALTPLVSLDGRFSYITFPGEGDGSIIPIEATATVKLGMIYTGVGAGYYTFGGDNHPDAEFGWYLLAGISVMPGPVSIFGEYKWQNLEIDGFDLESHVFHVGVNFGP